MDRIKGIKEAFDRYADEYDKWFDSPEGKIIFTMEVEAIRLLMKDLEKPFLEVGVGTGRFAEELGIDTGIDPSHKALELAEKKGISVREGKGENLPFEDDYFGTVFLIFTLCFVEDSERVLFESRRVLKKGGGFIVGIINRESQWGQLNMRKRGEGHPIYQHAHFWSPPEVKELIEKTGMVIEAYSSTLCQPPSETPYNEAAHKGLADGAGFVCILARKVNS